MNSLMELDRKSLQNITERAQAAHNQLNDEIESRISFCRFCSERGRYCDVADPSFVEREKLIAIRNSMKEVENMLVYLQKLQAWQLIDRHSVFTSLGKSRIHLMEQVKGYQGRQLDVVNELSSSFSNERSGLNSNAKDQKNAGPGVDNGKRRIFSFLISLGQWNWTKAIRIAAKLIVVSASIASTLQHFYHSSRQKNGSSHRRILSSVDSSTDAGVNNQPTIPNSSPLDVFSGRG